MLNPYPESVFTPMDLSEATKALEQAGISPDRVFGNWGREVWENARQETLKVMGKWLKQHYTDCDGRRTYYYIHDADLEALLRGEMPGG